jgi:hypothetical protein
MNKTHLRNEATDTPSIHNSNIIAPALLNFFSWLSYLNSLFICSPLSHFIFFSFPLACYTHSPTHSKKKSLLFQLTSKFVN